MGQKFVQSDYPTQSGSLYPANIDADIKVMARLAASYNPCAEDTPSALKVVVQAGAMFVNGALVANASQTVTLAAAHATLPRIDRVVIDALTGVASKIDGTANASPVAPAILFNKLPVAQVLVSATMTVVANSTITDERIPVPVRNTRQCHLKRTADQTGLSSGTIYPIGFDAEISDALNFHDNVTNNSRITITDAGVAEIKFEGQIMFSANANGIRLLMLYKNGAVLVPQIEHRMSAGGVSQTYSVRLSTPWLPVTLNDYFELQGYQDSGSSLSALFAASYFAAEFR